jgi:hypothetical protein
MSFRRISPIFSHEPIVQSGGQLSDIFRKWFQTFSEIANEYFVSVRLASSPNQHVAVLQNSILTTAQRDDIEPTDLDEGMQMFNTTTKKLQVYDGTTWVDLH